MLDILTDISEGRGTEEDLEMLEELAVVIKESSLCGLGKTAPNPVLTTIQYFRHEYKAHIKDKKCPAHVCRELNVYNINAELCEKNGHGCGVCRRECPEDAITGKKGKPHRVIQDKCEKCGVCYDVCKFDAVYIE